MEYYAAVKKNDLCSSVTTNINGKKCKTAYCIVHHLYFYFIFITTSITYQEHSVELENKNEQKQHAYIFKPQKTV